MKNEYQRLLEYFGKEIQMNKLLEELLELSLALSQYKCPTKDSQQIERNIVDEIADVYIMLEQAKLIFGKDAIEERVRFKIERALHKYIP